MKKTLLTVFLSITLLPFAFAQSDVAPTIVRDTVVTKHHGKIFEHYIGVQMNELVRQVFNFNNSTASTNTNPYLATYTITHVRTGWGIHFGAGYTYNDFVTDDGITRKDSKINDIHFRVGIEKRWNFSDKWQAGAGLDFVYNNNDDYTKSVVKSTDTTTTETTSTVNNFGGGASGWIRYHISKNILVGTEASYYYTTGKQKQDIAITALDPSFPGGNRVYVTNVSTVDNTSSLGSFSVPISFFLIVKF
ncbi:MAG: hypothetical protein WCG87_03395 [Bacteroidota bacterium]